MAERGKHNGWLIGYYVLLFGVGAVVVWDGSLQVAETGAATELSIGVLGLILVAALLPIAIAQSSHAANFSKSLARLDRMVVVLESINDRLMISDKAKSIRSRARERDALRRAIRDDMDKGDFDAALAMVTQMSQAYGYHKEAEDYRDEIQTARAAEMETKVTEGITRLDQVLASHEWDKALPLAAKIQRLYPDSPRVKTLNRRIIEAREQHKHDLERKFLEAAQRDDVDVAMELMLELDKYLTESEAEPFRETARGVIGKKRDNLGVQFKLAVSDKEWTRAVRVGEQIIREFPNSKMANEVRSMLDLLRERAAGEQAARTSSSVL